MFLHFWAIPAGLAALCVPFVVHWLTKPRPRRMPLSTIRFVREIVQQRQARNRLRDLLILLLRAAAIALFAAAIARPLTAGKAALSGDPARGQTLKVVILDVSQSMAALSRGIQALERARPIAARHVDYQAATQTNLILAGAAPEAVFDRPSTNFTALVEAVSRVRPLPQRLQVQAALNSAAEMLAGAEGETPKRELVVISDFQRTNWSAADFSVLPVDTAIELESIAATETPVNLSVNRVGWQGRVERGRPLRLEVDVGNYSPSPRPVTVEVSIGDHQLRLQGTATAGGRSTVVGEVELTTEGWNVGEARLTGLSDGLSEDDRRSFVVQVHRPPTYLLLTRQPAGAKAVSSYYLERAISPVVANDAHPHEKVVRVDPARAEREVLATADLLVLDHPGKLSEDTLQLVSGMLRRGRGVLYVAAEPIDATNLKLLSAAAGTSLQMPVEFSPPPAGQARKNLFLVDVRRRESPFNVFGEEATALFSPVRFSGGLATRRVEGALLDDVLATYNDQSACLVVTACGAGLLAVLNADLGASSLPSSPAFVPIIGELTALLLGRDRSQESLASGEPLAVYLPATAGPLAGLRIAEPTESAVDPAALGQLHEEAVGVIWQAAAAGPPGVYEVKRGRETVFALAAAVPPEESDLATLPPDVVTGRLAGGRDVQYRSALHDDRPRDDLWAWLLVACVGCVIAEVVGLKAFKT